MKTKYCSPQLVVFNIKITNSLLNSSPVTVDASKTYDASNALSREFDDFE